MAALSSIESRIAATPDGRISYLEAGRGTPLVLLHGIGSAACSWRNQLAALSGRFRIIAWDAPGYSQSTPLAEDKPDAGAYAYAIGAFLDSLGITRCHLVGHSLGTLMAVRFATDNPRRILSLSLSSIAIGHLNLPVEERERLLTSRLGDLEAMGARAMAEKRGPRLLGPDATPEMRQAVIDAMAQVQSPGYAQASRMLSGGNTLADIERLPADMPVQIIYGDADVITPPAANQRAAALRPSAPVHVIPGAGHALYLEKPDQFSGILADFAETHDER